MQRLHIKSTRREELLPMSSRVAAMVRERGWRNGAVLVYCPHTTAGVAVNESADPDVRTDIRAFMEHLVPRDADFRHAEGNSDAHIKSGLFGQQCFVPVENGALQLGTWQEVYFCEWDGPRTRELWLQFLPNSLS